MNQIEAHRLAAAINQLRPEWPLASLASFIAKNLATRPYRDAAIALTWIACDPETVNPGRVLENGPWWKATQAQAGTVSTIAMHCPDHPTERAWDCKPCADDVADIDTGLALVRAALKDAPPPPRPAHPQPPATDLRDTRAHIDAQEQP